MYHLYTDMPLIEGVGDEVTVVFTLFALFLILVIAWVSTNIQELPFFSVIVIEFTRRHNRNQQQTNPVESSESSTGSSSGDDSTGEQGSQEEPESVTGSTSKDSCRVQSPEGNNVESVEAVSAIRASSSEPTNLPKETENSCTRNSAESPNIPNEVVDLDEEIEEELPASETELRRRRVAFFSGSSVSSESKSAEKELHQETVVCNENSSVAKDPNTNAKTSSNSQEQNESVTSQNSNDSEPTDNDNSNDRVRIRLKYLNETQRHVEASLDDTIDQFRRTHFSEELAANKLVRFIFNGQDLRNGTNTLQAYNIVDNSVIHCLITQANQQASAPAADNDDGFDIGLLMVPCFGFLLLFVWYMRFEYKQFFSGTSTVCLIGITLLYIAALLATWENHRRGRQEVHVD